MHWGHIVVGDFLRPSPTVRQWASETWLAQGNAIEADVPVEQTGDTEWFDGNKIPVSFVGAGRLSKCGNLFLLQAVVVDGTIGGHDADVLNPGWTRYRATPMTFEIMQVEVRSWSCLGDFRS